MKFAGRFSNPGMPYEGLIRWTPTGAKWNGTVRLVEEKLQEPYKWRTPRRVFVNSMSDLFHEEIPDQYIADVFAVMGECEKHTFQVLTKRADRMEEWFNSWFAGETASYLEDHDFEWPPPNVWIGVSCENQQAVMDRVPPLLASPAAVKFISAEPLIGEIDLMSVECPLYRSKFADGRCSLCGNGQSVIEGTCIDGYFNALEEGIDWVIVGCETGNRSSVREMDESWVRLLRDQCVANGTAFFYKQALSGQGKKISLPALDGQQWKEYPNEPRR